MRRKWSSRRSTTKRARALTLDAVRRSVLDGRALPATERVQGQPLPFATRFNLRGGADVGGPAAQAFGVASPMKPLSSAASGARAALWLGPDEWLLIAEESASGLMSESGEGARRRLPQPRRRLASAGGYLAGGAGRGAAARGRLSAGPRSASFPRRHVDPHAVGESRDRPVAARGERLPSRGSALFRALRRAHPRRSRARSERRLRLALGVDAAWTATEPSGVALVAEREGGWRLLAVESSYARFRALAAGAPPPSPRWRSA